VARLATLAPDGRPHLVPVTFVLERPSDVVWIVVDDKPKSTRRLRRVTNIEADPRVSLVVDHYEEDWDRLWWVRADGNASVEEVSTVAGDAALIALRAKYPQEADADRLGPLIRVEVQRWAAWSAVPPNQT
jgi:PPOX class probable F420-dependent enzyme